MSTLVHIRHQVRPLRAAAVCIAIVAFGLVLGSSGTSYAASPAPAWGAASSVVLPSGPNGVNAPASDPRVTITSISCWSAGNCAAVGTYVVQATPSNFEAALLLMELNHVWQPSLEGIDPGVGQFELPSVSCAAGGACVAVGSYRTGNAHNDILPDVFTATGGVWSHSGAALQIPSDKITNGLQQVGKLASVSCESAGNCVAVGHYYATYATNSIQISGMILTEAGGSWQLGVTIVPPSDSSASQDVEPSSVSCSPTGQCGAVGHYEPVSGPGSTAFSLAGSGGTLSTAAVTLPLPSGASSGGNGIEAPSISCGSVGCAATYPYFEGAGGRSGTTYALETKATGGGWADVAGLVGPSPDTASRNVAAVACAPSACAAVGNAGANAAGSSFDPAFGWDQTAGNWGTTGQQIQPFSGPTLNPVALACAAAGNCTTVGVFNPFGQPGGYYGFAASEVDGTWQPAVQLQMAFGSAVDGPDPFFGGVSCPDTGDCAAAGYYYDASGHQQGFVIDATAGSTSATHALTVSRTGTGTGTMTSSPAGISCPGTCSHGYPSGTVVTLTAAAAAGSTFAGWGGACTGTGACKLVMSSDQAVTSTFTATNPHGPTAAQIKGSLLSQIAPHGKAAKLATVLHNAGYTFSFIALEAGHVVISWYMVPKGAHVTAAKPVVVATGRETFAAAGKANIKVGLSAAGKRLLKHATLLRLTARGSFTPAHGSAVVALKRFTLKR